MLSSTDCGRDRDAASKLLTKHKVIMNTHFDFFIINFNHIGFYCIS